jgi:hypothetical protein
MKKMFLGAVLVLLLSLGFAVYYLLSGLDGMVKTAIETSGSQATQTAVRVESVQIVLKDGSAAIRGLTIANPQGFSASQGFSLGEITAQINLKSLSEEVTVIEHITVRGPEVFFELNEAGKNNLAELKRNLSTAASGSSASGKGNTAEPKLIIRKLLFTEGSIHARVVPLGKDYELRLPTLELNNLGGKNGATPTQIADQVLKVLTDRALAEVKKQGLDQYKGKLEGEVNKRLQAEKNQLGEKLGDQFKEVFSY